MKQQLHRFRSYSRKILCLSLFSLMASFASAQTVTYYRDYDGDGFGSTPKDFPASTPLPAGYSTIGGDCNDANTLIHPGGFDECDFLDNDCDGEVDEGCHVFYEDSDGDNFGLWHKQTRDIALPAGYALVGGDCNDADATIYPGAPEICDGKDNNCNLYVDEFAECPHGPGIQAPSAKALPEQPPFNIAGYPNPTTHAFNLLLEGDRSKGKFSVRVLNNIGTVVEVRNDLSAGQVLKLGTTYPRGIYFIEVVQGIHRRTIRLLKQ